MLISARKEKYVMNSFASYCGQVLIEIYGHRDNDNFWRVMVEFGEGVAVHARQKTKFTANFPIPNRRQELDVSWDEEAIDIMKDLAYLLKLNFAVEEDKKSYTISS